jgi:hypothetical protein
MTKIWLILILFFVKWENIMEFFKIILIIVFVLGCMYKIKRQFKPRRSKPINKARIIKIKARELADECQKLTDELGKTDEGGKSKVALKLENLYDIFCEVGDGKVDISMDRLNELIQQFDYLQEVYSEQMVRNEEKRLILKNTIKKEKKEGPQPLMTMVKFVKTAPFYYSDKAKDIELLNTYIKYEDFDSAMEIVRNIFEKTGQVGMKNAIMELSRMEGCEELILELKSMVDE